MRFLQVNAVAKLLNGKTAFVIRKVDEVAGQLDAVECQAARENDGAMRVNRNRIIGLSIAIADAEIAQSADGESESDPWFEADGRELARKTVQ